MSGGTTLLRGPAPAPVSPALLLLLLQRGGVILSSGAVMSVTYYSPDQHGQPRVLVLVRRGAAHDLGHGPLHPARGVTG